MPDSLTIPEKVRTVVLAPYAAVRAGLHVLLQQRADIDVVAEASGTTDLEAILSAARPRAVVADPHESEISRLIAMLAGAEVALVLIGESPDRLDAIRDANIAGWALLYRDADAVEIGGAVRAAAAGLVAMDRATADLAMAHNHASAAAQNLISMDDGLLTPRERDVLQLMASGLPNKVIGARLGVSLHTVKFHVASILSKLDAESRTEAVTTGARRGLVAL